MSQNSAESARVQFFKYKVAKMSKIGTFGRLSGRLPDLEYVLSLVPKDKLYSKGLNFTARLQHSL